MATVDITNHQYTENSSNANSVDKSEFMREMNQDDCVQKPVMRTSEINQSKMVSSSNQKPEINEQSFLDQQTIPLNNKDVIARAK